MTLETVESSLLKSTHFSLCSIDACGDPDTPSSERKGTCLIPRTIHQIWLGSPLPKRFVQLRESWRSRHQGWELRLWTNADVDAFGLENREAYDNAPNFGEKSDILRYEVRLSAGFS